MNISEGTPHGEDFLWKSLVWHCVGESLNLSQGTHMSGGSPSLTAMRRWEECSRGTGLGSVFEISAPSCGRHVSRDRRQDFPVRVWGQVQGSHDSLALCLTVTQLLASLPGPLLGSTCPEGPQSLLHV